MSFPTGIDLDILYAHHSQGDALEGMLWVLAVESCPHLHGRRVWIQIAGNHLHPVSL